jgi:hypothetical protein
MSVIVRKGHASFDTGSRIAITTLAPRRVATAIRSGGDKLKLATWEIDPNGTIEKGSEVATIDTISDVKLTTLTPNRMVTAARSGTGMKLSVWEFNKLSSPAITQKGFASLETTFSTPGVSLTYAIAAVTGSRVVTANNFGTGKLRVTIWDVSTDGDLAEKESAVTDTIKGVAIATLTSSRIVTAVRSGNDGLRLSVWDLGADGTLMKVGEDSMTDPIKELAITSLGSAQIGTALRMKNDDLNVGYWTLNAAGQIQQVVGTSGGAIEAVEIPRGPTVSSGMDFATVDLSSKGALEIKAWDVVPNGIVLVGEAALAGEGTEGGTTKHTIAIREIAAAGWADSTAPDGVVTAVRDALGNLRGIVWHVEDTA